MTRIHKKRDASSDGPWMKRQRHIVASLALFTGCAVIISRSSLVFEPENTWGAIGGLRQGDTSSTRSSLVSSIGKRVSQQISNPQRLRSRQNQNRTTHSPFESEFDVIQIPINPLATLHDDVTSIEHLPALSRIDLRLRHGARCPRPYLMGRLSGPALVMIQDWKWGQIRNLRDNTKTTMLTGHYQVPDSGQYHLDIIALHCDDSLNNMKEHSNRRGTNNETEAWDMEIETNMCMEDPWRHRLTEETATITVDHSVGAMMDHQVDVKGHWRNHNWLQNQNPHETAPSPLFTRFHSTMGPYWGEPSNASTRDDYTHDIQHSAPKPQLEVIVQKLQKLKEAHICLVGPSQSHEQQHLFRQQVNQLLGRGNKTDAKLVSSWGHVQSPGHVTAEFARNLVHNQKCRKLVFLWSTANDDTCAPAKIVDFYHSVGTMLRNIVNLRDSLSDSHPLEVYTASLRYRSLDVDMTACPPKDWQSPPLIDAYNAAMAKACNDLGGAKKNVTFLDTRPLVNPMWDFFDRNSPAGRENRDALAAESLHLAQAVLGLSDSGLVSSNRHDSERATNKWHGLW